MTVLCSFEGWYEDDRPAEEIVADKKSQEERLKQGKRRYDSYKYYDKVYNTAIDDLEPVVEGVNPIVKGYDRTEWILYLLQILHDKAAYGFYVTKSREVPMLDEMIRQYKQHGNLIQTTPCRDAVLEWLEMEQLAGSYSMPSYLLHIDIETGRKRDKDEPKATDTYPVREWLKKAEPHFPLLVERHVLAINQAVNDIAARHYH